jgi:hypothetical protein
MTFEITHTHLFVQYITMSRSRSRSRSPSRPRGDDQMDLEMDRLPSEDRVRERPDEEEVPVKYVHL